MRRAMSTPATAHRRTAPENAKQQIDKRIRKFTTLRTALPDPELIGAQTPETLLIGWGEYEDCCGRCAAHGGAPE